MVDYKLKKKGINMKRLLLFKFGSVFFSLFKLIFIIIWSGWLGYNFELSNNKHMYNLGMIDNKSKSLKSVT